MPGESEPLYALARRVLLDGLEALQAHQPALVLVGAQAIYLHTQEAELALAPYTTDADLVLNPPQLEAKPLLDELMMAAGFRPGSQPGIWVTTRALGKQSVDVAFDLLVPESLGGGGRRGARLPGHGSQVARKARGLEAALVDHAQLELGALESDDPRRREVLVAGPSALLVAKLHKLGERLAQPERLKPKDAYDVFRLLRVVPPAVFDAGLRQLLDHPLSAESTQEARTYLERLFVVGPGARLTAQATAGLEPAEVVEASSLALARELLNRWPGS